MSAKKAKSPAASANAAELLKAARGTTPDKLKKLLDAGANVGVRDKQGWTALHAAASDARLKSVELLLKLGADPNAEDEREDTPLHHALAARANINDRELEDRTAIAQALIEAGADIEARGSEGRTALWGACNLARGKAERLVAFVMARKPDLSAADEEDYSILHMATIWNHETVGRAALHSIPSLHLSDGNVGSTVRSKMVQMLLDSGADPNAKDPQGLTPLQHFFHDDPRHWSLDAIAILVKAGANVDVRVKNDKGKSVTVKALLAGAPPPLCRDAKGFAKLSAILGD